jgi:LuxR family maltose regulon positive regulatory protein
MGGGLLFFFEALERLSETEKEKYISEQLPDRFRSEVFQYFDNVILASQPPEIRRFLLTSAILDRIEPDFVENLTETENMEKVLLDTARKNFFVQSTYDEEGKSWVFRYHNLFRDFLLLKFKAEMGPDTRQALFLKAGRLYEQRGRLEEAIKYFLAAGTMNRLFRLSRKPGWTWYGHRGKLICCSG